MPLLLVHIQNLSHFTCQSRIELTETVSAVLMYSALTNPEFLRRLTHRCLCRFVIRKYFSKYKDKSFISGTYEFTQSQGMDDIMGILCGDHVSEEIIQ